MRRAAQSLAVLPEDGAPGGAVIRSLDLLAGAAAMTFLLSCAAVVCLECGPGTAAALRRAAPTSIVTARDPSGAVTVCETWEPSDAGADRP